LAKVDYSNTIWSTNAYCRDFVKSCLVCNPEKRLTVREAVSHKWITTNETGLG
jgi:serine/threonine protein kinase